MKNTCLALSLMCIYSSAQAIPLPVQTIKGYECGRCSNLSHELLKANWALANKPLQSALTNKQQSYGFKQQVSSQELQKGIPLTLLGPGAIIRVSPINGTLAPSLLLQTPNNTKMTLQEASLVFSEKETLASSFSPEKDTIAQLKPELGQGRFILKSQGQTQNNLSYMVSVLDKNSLTHLDVATDALFYHYGDKLKVNIDLNHEYTSYDSDDIDAFLVAPTGETVRMDVKETAANHFVATHTLRSEQSDNGENWYVKVAAEKKAEEDNIRRSGQAAFSYSIPSASLVEIKKNAGSLSFSAKVKVATASRYSLQAVLFKKSNDKFYAQETTQTSTWLESGSHSIEFTFDNSAQLAEDQLYLGYLRLIDYGQLKMVYHYDKPMQLSQLVE